jgi:hypothetical protein
MLARLGLHAIERELELEVERLLRPERAVVVEHRDALGRRDEARAALRRDGRDEREEALLGHTVVPGGERVGRGDDREADDAQREHADREDETLRLPESPQRSSARARRACHAPCP